MSIWTEGDAAAVARELAGTWLSELRAKDVHYDVQRDHVVLLLTTGVEVSLARKYFHGLQDAAPADLVEIEVGQFGLDLRFPRLDADFLIAPLLQGALGSRLWMAKPDPSLTGRTHGSMKTAVCELVEALCVIVRDAELSIAERLHAADTALRLTQAAP